MKFWRFYDPNSEAGSTGADAAAGVQSADNTQDVDYDDSGLTPEEKALAAHEAQEAKTAQAAKATQGAAAQQSQQQQAESGAGKPALDDEAIRKVADSVVSRLTPKQQPEPFKMTPEILESLKPVRVSKQDIADLFPDATDAQVAAMQKFANSIVTNAVHTSRFINDRILEKEKESFAPIVQYYESQQSEVARKHFFETNKDLAKYPKFVSAAAARLAQDPETQNMTAHQVATKVAELTRIMLREVIPNFGSDSTNTDAASPASGQENGVPHMAQLSGAGRSLSASQGKGKQNNPDADIYS